MINDDKLILMTINVQGLCVHWVNTKAVSAYVAINIGLTQTQEEPQAHSWGKDLLEN